MQTCVISVWRIKYRYLFLICSFSNLNGYINIFKIIFSFISFCGCSCRDIGSYVPTDEYRKFGKVQPDSLGAIVRSFKSAVTKRINELGKNTSKSVWQSNYYEHIIRNEKKLFFTRRYIELNPLKWELDEYYNSGNNNIKLK